MLLRCWRKTRSASLCRVRVPNTSAIRASNGVCVIIINRSFSLSAVSPPLARRKVMVHFEINVAATETESYPYFYCVWANYPKWIQWFCVCYTNCYALITLIKTTLIYLAHCASWMRLPEVSSTLRGSWSIERHAQNNAKLLRHTKARVVRWVIGFANM